MNAFFSGSSHKFFDGKSFCRALALLALLLRRSFWADPVPQMDAKTPRHNASFWFGHPSFMCAIPGAYS